MESVPQGYLAISFPRHLFMTKVRETSKSLETITHVALSKTVQCMDTSSHCRHFYKISQPTCTDCTNKAQMCWGFILVAHTILPVITHTNFNLFGA